MGIPATKPEFFALLAQSNLLDANTVTQYASSLSSVATENTAASDGPSQVADALVRDGVLTRFQADQLLQGKWRGFFIGRYKVLGILGAGGMGKVFLCEHPGMRRQVAIKVLPPKQAGDAETVERFYREAQAIARLDHRNIIHAFDVAQDGDVHYLVMEYVKGVTLEDCVSRDGRLGHNRVIDYLRQSALGLQHAFESGVVHRDIKPSNLLITETGIVKILDLGLARFFEEDAELSSRFGGGVMGTIDYMAPEQALDSSAVDIRADIYSLGATFYFALIGRSPFEGASTTQKLLWHQVRDPEPLKNIRPELPTELTDIIARMMCKDPAQRYQTPDELLAALAIPAGDTVESLAQSSVDTSIDLPYEPPIRTRKDQHEKQPAPARKFPKKIAFVGLLCVGSAAAGVYVQTQDRKAEVVHTEPAPTKPIPPQTAKPATTSTVPVARPIYLSDLSEEDATVGRGQFGKGGSLGYDNRQITVKGSAMFQGLSMHPPANGSSHVRYEIYGNFRSLAGQVAINDTGAGKPVGLVFTVKGDGRVLWESRPVRTKQDQQPFAIDVAGVRRLELEVRCPGNNDNAHAVWCDPKLLKTPPSLADIASPKPIDQEGFIRAWLILAPIPSPSNVDPRQAVDRQLVKDEGKLAPKEGDKVKVGDKELTWDKVLAEEYFFDMDTGSGTPNNCSVYAVTYVVAPEEIKDVDLRFGSDDGAKVYLNGKEVGKSVNNRGIGKDQNTCSDLTLKKGVNTVVFKVVNVHGDWKGALRFVDRNGTPIPGLKAQFTK
ncbi:MAG: hypothetical protein C0467_00330 [Planctomycetaceae bacterium]|nr:hypothetical protein [Planctomycetaceae bacterium]